MKNKGFTLIEVIAVVGIIGIMSILVMPLIMNQIAEKKDEISETTSTLIFNAADLYLNDNIATYPKQIGNVYCVKINELINKGYLKSPLKDVTSGKNIDTSRVIRLEVNVYREYDNYNILNKNESCS